MLFGRCFSTIGGIRSGPLEDLFGRALSILVRERSLQKIRVSLLLVKLVNVTLFCLVVLNSLLIRFACVSTKFFNLVPSLRYLGELIDS